MNIKIIALVSIISLFTNSCSNSDDKDTDFSSFLDNNDLVTKVSGKWTIDTSKNNSGNKNLNNTNQINFIEFTKGKDFIIYDIFDNIISGTYKIEDNFQIRLTDSRIINSIAINNNKIEFLLEQETESIQINGEKSISQVTLTPRTEILTNSWSVYSINGNTDISNPNIGLPFKSDKIDIIISEFGTYFFRHSFQGEIKSEAINSWKWKDNNEMIFCYTTYDENPNFVCNRVRSEILILTEQEIKIKDYYVTEENGVTIEIPYTITMRK